MKKTTTRKLALKLTTLRHLAGSDLSQIVGGSTIGCPTNIPPHTSNNPAQCGGSFAATTCDVSVNICPSDACGPSFNTSPEC